ncbi:MAG: amidohydrolase [Dehalococcoidia bacterium]|nr:amidohydrolase [Dehalococcoidia bacterium]
MSTLKLISADSHVIEPRDLWLKYMEPKYRSRAPHCVRENGKDVFKCEGGVTLIQVGALGGAGISNDKLKYDGTYEEAPPGAWDPIARVKEMAVDGVQAEVLYPSVALRMFGIPDLDYQLACFRAYNAWLGDFVRQRPKEFKGIGIVPIDDMETATGEVRRCKELGLSGVAISVNPQVEKGYDSAFYDPLWAAAQDYGMPVSMHILTERKAGGAQRTGYGRYMGQVTEPPRVIQEVLGLMLLSGVFRRFPGLKVVSAENDAGWAGYFVERLDYVVYKRGPHYDTKVPMDIMPSEFFRRNVFLTFMRDRSGILIREIIGKDNLLWSSDYPHQDSTWPDSRKLIEKLMGDIPEADRHKILADNCAKLYGFA